MIWYESVEPFLAATDRAEKTKSLTTVHNMSKVYISPHGFFMTSSYPSPLG